MTNKVLDVHRIPGLTVDLFHFSHGNMITMDQTWDQVVDFANQHGLQIQIIPNDWDDW